MIPRCRRMVPGMLASLLLAVPLYVPHAQASTLTARHGAHHATRRTVESRRHAARHKLAWHRRAAPHHGQHVAAALHHGQHVAAAPAVAFFDDGAPIRHAFWQQSGIASWYGGPRWQGKRTASGVRYEQDGLTAAHATLPLGSKVRVTLEGSGRSVVVTINDRPGTRTRIIDLSRGAARALGILDRGVARVTLTAER